MFDFLVGQDQDADGDVDVDGVDDRTQRRRNPDRLKTPRASRTRLSKCSFCVSSRFFGIVYPKYFNTDVKFEFRENKRITMTDWLLNCKVCLGIAVALTSSRSCELSFTPLNSDFMDYIELIR